MLTAAVPAVLCLLAVAVMGVPSTVDASERATATVAATAQLSARTALTVSTDILRFDVSAAGTPAIARVDFVAGARTRADGEVLLTVEPLQALSGPGGAADVDASVDFSGDGDGLLNGVLTASRPAVAGRWTGSGRRTGHLQFTLHTRTTGAYSLPVRFVLSAP